jgi:hypothetical protein
MTSKTGGGVGTNQHAVKGRSVQDAASAAAAAMRADALLTEPADNDEFTSKWLEGADESAYYELEEAAARHGVDMETLARIYVENGSTDDIDVSQALAFELQEKAAAARHAALRTVPVTERPSYALYTRDARYAELVAELRDNDDGTYAFGWEAGRLDATEGLRQMQTDELAGLWHQDYSEGYLDAYGGIERDTTITELGDAWRAVREARPGYTRDARFEPRNLTISNGCLRDSDGNVLVTIIKDDVFSTSQQGWWKLAVVVPDDEQLRHLNGAVFPSEYSAGLAGRAAAASPEGVFAAGPQMNQAIARTYVGR